MSEQEELKLLDGNLRHLIHKGNLDEIKSFIDKNRQVDLNFPDEGKNTPLFFAINEAMKSRDTNIVEYLVRKGANPELKNSLDQNAHDFLWSLGQHNELSNILSYTTADKPKAKVKEIPVSVKDSPVTVTQFPTSPSGSPLTTSNSPEPIHQPIAIRPVNLFPDKENEDSRKEDSVVVESPTNSITQDSAIVLTELQQQKLEEISKLKKMVQMNMPEGAIRQKAKNFGIVLDGDIKIALEQAENQVRNPPKKEEISLTEEQQNIINKFTKMAKMLPIGAVIQRAAMEGFNLPQDTTKENIETILKEQMLNPTKTEPKKVSKPIEPQINLLDANDYNKPIDEVRSKINTLPPEYIVKEGYILKAIEANNVEMASLLITKLSSAKLSDKFTKEQQKEAVKSAIISTFQNLNMLSSGRLDADGKSELVAAQDKNQSVNRKYEHIRNLSIDAEELTEAKQRIYPEKTRIVLPSKRATEEARIAEKYRLDLIAATYPTLNSDEQSEKKSAEELLATALSNIEQRQRVVKTATINAFKKDVISQDADIIHAFDSIENTELRKQIREGINAYKIANQSKEMARDTEVQSSKSLPKLISISSPELSQGFNNLVATYHGLAKAVDTNKSDLALVDRRDAALENVQNALYVGMVPEVIKLKKLQTALEEQGEICANLDKCIDESFKHHFTHALAYKEDSTYRIGIDAALSPKGEYRTNFNKEVQDPINIHDVEQTWSVPESLSAIQEEMKKTLVSLGINRNKIEIMSHQQFKAQQEAKSIKMVISEADSISVGATNRRRNIQQREVGR